MDASLWPALTNTLSTLQFFRHGGFVYKVVMERNGYGWFWYGSKFANSHLAGKTVFGCINVAGYDVRTVRIVCVNAFGERQQCCNIFLKNCCCGVVFLQCNINHVFWVLIDMFCNNHIKTTQSMHKKDRSNVRSLFRFALAAHFLCLASSEYLDLKHGQTWTNYVG